MVNGAEHVLSGQRKGGGRRDLSSQGSLSDVSLLWKISLIPEKQCVKTGGNL